MLNKKCIVRGKDSGVFYGEVTEINGSTVKMINFRKIYEWYGATCVEGLAMYGTKNPDDCKFTLFVNEGIISDMIQCILCTDESIKSIEGVKIWTI